MPFITVKKCYSVKCCVARYHTYLCTNTFTEVMKELFIPLITSAFWYRAQVLVCSIKSANEALIGCELQPPYRCRWQRMQLQCCCYWARWFLPGSLDFLHPHRTLSSAGWSSGGSACSLLSPGTASAGHEPWRSWECGARTWRQRARDSWHCASHTVT